MLKTSRYFKIRDAVKAAARHAGDAKSLADVMEGVFDSFTYKKKDSHGKPQTHHSASSTIRRSIKLCIDLGLIKKESDATLTDAGRNALDDDRFDYQLQQAVFSYLEKKKLPLIKIEAAIDKLPLPDAASLYHHLSPDISEDMFRTCLFLLAACGESQEQNVLESFQRRVYLTEAKVKRMREGASHGSS